MQSTERISHFLPLWYRSWEAGKQINAGPSSRDAHHAFVWRVGRWWAGTPQEGDEAGGGESGVARPSGHAHAHSCISHGLTYGFPNAHCCTSTCAYTICCLLSMSRVTRGMRLTVLVAATRLVLQNMKCHEVNYKVLQDPGLWICNPRPRRRDVHMDCNRMAKREIPFGHNFEHVMQ